MIRLHVDVIGLNRLPLAPAIRTEMVADVARAARQAVRDSFQSMLDRTQSQGFWGAAKRSINPPVIRDNKATIDITHIGVRLQWLGGTVKPSGRKSEVTGRRIKSLLIPFKDSPPAPALPGIPQYPGGGGHGPGRRRYRQRHPGPRQAA